MSAFSQVPLIVVSDYEIKCKQLEGNDPNSVYLAGDEYRDHDGKQWLLPSVKLAEQEIREEQPIIADYFFPNMYLFSELATKLILGEDSQAIKEDRVYSTQTVSGTAALRLGAEFLVSVLGKTIYYYSEPTWDNLLIVFEKAGFNDARSYRYWSSSTNDIDFSGLLEDLKNAPETAVIVLQASAHNPTGVDLTKDQWKQIAAVMKERKLIPFFDSAFQGLAKDLEEDAWPVRYFVEQDIELFCAQSFSKMCGLYSERIGNFFVVTKNTHNKNLVEGTCNPILRGIYLAISAPANRIVTRLWSKNKFKQQWIRDIEAMRKRIADARKELSEALERLGTPGDWSFITRQVGMITLIGLNEAQVEHLAHKYHVYMKSNGLANLSAITQSNVQYVARAIHDTITSISSEKMKL